MRFSNPFFHPIKNRLADQQVGVIKTGRQCRRTRRVFSILKLLSVILRSVGKNRETTRQRARKARVCEANKAL
ncbi:hypothetical protein EDB36_11354 [Vibrio crassostreae]|nr:hypothetical protein EDB36_11354 [Vibrio crassostreae]